MLNACDKFSFIKKQDEQDINTVVDFSSVDTYPSFKICDSLINKEEKYQCFSSTFYQVLNSELQKHSFEAKDSIDEIIKVVFLINSTGNIEVEDIISSEIIQNQLPKLDSVIKHSVINLPKIYPAIKRGVFVTTKHNLHIRVKLKE